MIEYGLEIPNEIVCLPNTLYVEEIEHGVRTTKWGFEIPAEEMRSDGLFIRPRWGKVLFKADNIKEFNVGDYILMPHGHWSRGFKATIKNQEKKIWFLTDKSYKEIIALTKTQPKQMNEYGY